MIVGIHFFFSLTFILLNLFQGKIINRPLAGTVRRGKTEKEDEMQEQQLLSDEKQCAEHIMLVDLGRNDVGKVCVLFFRWPSHGCINLTDLLGMC